MIYILEVAVKEKGSSDLSTVWLRKQIDFAPSKGLIMNCHQLGGSRIGTVHTDGEQIVAWTENVIEPTSGETLKYLLENGWKLKDEFKPYVPAKNWVS